MAGASEQAGASKRNTELAASGIVRHNAYHVPGHSAGAEAGANPGAGRNRLVEKEAPSEKKTNLFRASFICMRRTIIADRLSRSPHPPLPLSPCMYMHVFFLRLPADLCKVLLVKMFTS